MSVEKLMLVLSPVVTFGFGIWSFIYSQHHLKDIIEPMQDFNKLRGRIATALIIHARTSNSSANAEMMKAAEAEFRKLAGELAGAIEILPKHERKPNYYKAASDLVGLSNEVGPNVDWQIFDKKRSKIMTYLSLQNLDDPLVVEKNMSKRKIAGIVVLLLGMIIPVIVYQYTLFITKAAEVSPAAYASSIGILLHIAHWYWLIAVCSLSLIFGGIILMRSPRMRNVEQPRLY